MSKATGTSVLMTIESNPLSGLTVVRTSSTTLRSSEIFWTSVQGGTTFFSTLKTFCTGVTSLTTGKFLTTWVSSTWNDTLVRSTTSVLRTASGEIWTSSWTVLLLLLTSRGRNILLCAFLASFSTTPFWRLFQTSEIPGTDVAVPLTACGVTGTVPSLTSAVPAGLFSGETYRLTADEAK